MSSNHLILILDCHPSYFILNSTNKRNLDQENNYHLDNSDDESDEDTANHNFYNFLDQVQIFCNLYVNFVKKNRISILILLGDNMPPKWLIQNIDSNSISAGHYKNYSLKQKFEVFFNNLNENEVLASSICSPIASGLGTGLLYLNKMKVSKEFESNVKQYESLTTSSNKSADSISNSKKGVSNNLHGRLLLITNCCTADIQKQYLRFGIEF